MVAETPLTAKPSLGFGSCAIGSNSWHIAFYQKDGISLLLEALLSSSSYNGSSMVYRVV
jgi:hypothetical protein